MIKLTEDIYIKSELSSYQELFYKIKKHEIEQVFGKDSFKEVYVNIGDLYFTDDTYEFFDDLDYGRDRKYYKIVEKNLDKLSEEVIHKIYRKNLNAGIDRVFQTNDIVAELNSGYMLQIGASEYLNLECKKKEDKKVYNF